MQENSNWRNKAITEKQNKLIQELSEIPLVYSGGKMTGPIFKGKTRGEASDFISKWLIVYRETEEEMRDVGNEWAIANGYC